MLNLDNKIDDKNMEASGALKNVIKKPRCPYCGKVFLGALEGKAWHKCRGCKTEFMLDTMVDLTEIENRAIT